MYLEIDHPDKNIFSCQARCQIPLCKEAFPEVFEKVSKAGRQQARLAEKRG